MKKNNNLVRILVITAIPLIILQAAYGLFFWKGKTSSTREALDSAMAKVSGIDEQRRAIMKIQLAIEDYSSKNGGVPPSSLEQLRPEYFDIIPVDPKNGAQFSYKVVGGKPKVAYDILLAAAPVKGKGAKKAASGKVEEVVEVEIAPELINFVYDPVNKRDPFRPFDLAPKESDFAGKSQLERYDYGQLKLTAILEGFDEPKAVIENSTGRGFTVKKGMKIGLNGGEIVEIQKDRIFILETNVDFTGEKKTKTVEMKLRTKDQDEIRNQQNR